MLQRQVEVVRESVRAVLRDTGQLSAVVFSVREGALRNDLDPRVQQLLQQGRQAMASGDRPPRRDRPPVGEGRAGFGQFDATGGLGSTVTAGER